MAIVTNTFTTYDAKGIREELENIISNISPEDTPFQSNIGKGKVNATLFEWQMDSLAAAATNDNLEGDDITAFPATAATTRVGNYTQISRKLLILSGTEQEVDKAGRKSEEAYQLAKRASELKRDIEFICLNPQAGNAGALGTNRKTASMQAWIKTNVDKGVGGVDPAWTSGVPSAARTDGTQRAFTETILKSVIQKVWSAGGQPKLLQTGPLNKQVVSGFAGVATKTFYQSARATTAIIGAADVYVSDFGTLSIVPDRFQRDRDAWVVDTDYVSIKYLRPFQKIGLAKTGDADKKMLLVEWGLQVTNEAAHGLAADLS